MSYLLVNNEDPVRLDGTIDVSGNLQVRHSADYLVDYDQEMWCSHDSHESVIVKIYDFTVGATTWVMSAEHDSTSWNRSTDHCWFEFTEEPSEPLSIVVTATAGTAKQRPIKIKPQPAEQNLFAQPPAEQTL